MNIPPYIVAEACSRLQSGLDDRQWQKLLPILRLELIDDEPDYSDLRWNQVIETGEERCGYIPLEADLHLLGVRNQIALRYVYAGEFGYRPDEFEGFGHIGSVARLEVLSWPTDARSPDWSKVDIGILSDDMIEQIDEMVIERERQKSIT